MIIDSWRKIKQMHPIQKSPPDFFAIRLAKLEARILYSIGCSRKFLKREFFERRFLNNIAAFKFRVNALV